MSGARSNEATEGASDEREIDIIMKDYYYDHEALADEPDL